MNKRKLRQIAKKINHGKEINIKFVAAPPDHFCYLARTNTLEISSYYHRLPKLTQLVYLTHELGHANTVSNSDTLFITDYAAEYEANRWALFRLDEINLQEVSGAYEAYLKEIASMNVEDDYDEEYQESAADLLLELELI